MLLYYLDFLYIVFTSAQVYSSYRKIGCFFMAHLRLFKLEFFFACQTVLENVCPGCILNTSCLDIYLELESQPVLHGCSGWMMNQTFT